MPRFKYFNVLIIILILFSGCDFKKSLTPKEIVTEFIKAYNEKDYKAIKELVSDSLVLGDFTGFTISNSKSRFIEIVEWGEIFNSKTIAQSFSVEDNKVFVVELQDNDREQFLSGNPVLFQMSYLVEHGEIVEMYQDTMPGYTTSTSGRTEKYRNFLRWVAEYHAENIKAVNQLTKEGGMVFKSLMDEYKTLENVPPAE